MGEFSDEDGGVGCLRILKGRVVKNSDGESHHGWDNIHLIAIKWLGKILIVNLN